MVNRIRKSKLDRYINLIRTSRANNFSLKDIQLKLNESKVLVCESTIHRFCKKNNLLKIRQNNHQPLNFRSIISGESCTSHSGLSKKSSGFIASKSKLFQHTRTIVTYRKLGKSHQNIVKLLSPQIRVDRSTVLRFCQIIGI